VPLYRKSVEVFPTYENGRWGLAKTLEAEGNRAEARAAFEEGLRVLPGSYPLAYHYAQHLTDDDEIEEAEVAWRHAIEAGKGAARAHLGLATLLVREGEEEEAWKEGRLALVSEPSFAEARLFLAERYEKAGRILGAGQELSRARRSHPADANVTAMLLELASRHRELRPRVLLALPEIEKEFGGSPKDARLAVALEKTRK
jgi:tetratricopeptide (TPR) repeat protein